MPLTAYQLSGDVGPREKNVQLEKKARTDEKTDSKSVLFVLFSVILFIVMHRFYKYITLHFCSIVFFSPPFLFHADSNQRFFRK